MENFFGITEADLKDGKATFVNGDTPTMKIASIAKKEIKGTIKIIVDFVVVDGVHAGMKYSEFFGIASAGGRKALAGFLTAFMPAKDAAALADPTVLVNRKVTCKFEEYNGYTNPRNWKAVSDVPTQVAAAPVVQPAAPAASGVVEIAEQAQAVGELSKGIF